jgi:hypothetical protein
MTSFDLTRKQRSELFELLLPELEEYYNNTANLRVTPPLDLQEIRQVVRKPDFNNPSDVRDAVGLVTGALRKYSVHTPHPRYFGLFNPRPNFPSVIADLITATFNPQLAAWSHSHASRLRIILFRVRQKIGFPREIDGVHRRS